MKEVNEELEGNTPAWDSNLGRWIEPDEVLDNPEPVSNNATNETRGELPIKHCCEYDGAAEHFARHGELPQAMGSPGAIDWIEADPEAFEQRVNEMKYALAMEATHAKYGENI